MRADYERQIESINTVLEKLRREEEARQQALILKQKTDEKFMKQIEKWAVEE